MQSVNVNTATIAQFEALPGIGPSMAQRIVAYREKNGPFKKLEDLMNIQGIGEKSVPQAAARTHDRRSGRCQGHEGLSHIAARRPARGASLPEVLLTLALIGVVAAVHGRRCPSGATHAQAVRRRAVWLPICVGSPRMLGASGAVSRSSSTCRCPSRWRVLADGNGNGVTSVDVASGVDAPQTDWRLVFREGRARLAVARDLPSTDGNGTLAEGSSTRSSSASWLD